MTAKDWTQYAAEEIASHWTFGGGRDSYVTDEQRETIAQNLRDIILKHCPYIPLSTRCENCDNELLSTEGMLVCVTCYRNHLP